MNRRFKQNVIETKIENVPKTGNGRFNVTVPQPFPFKKRKGVSFREMAVAEMISQKNMEDQSHLDKKIKAKPIPKVVQDKGKYQRMLRN